MFSEVLVVELREVLRLWLAGLRTMGDGRPGGDRSQNRVELNKELVERLRPLNASEATMMVELTGLPLSTGCD